MPATVRRTADGRHARWYTVEGHEDTMALVFPVPPRYEVTRVAGEGAFGVVCAAADAGAVEGAGGAVAVKVCKRALSDPHDAAAAVTELRLLRHFAGHPHVAGLGEVLPFAHGPGAASRGPPPLLCYTMPLMDCDLREYMHSLPAGLARDEVRRAARQVLLGLDALHDAGVVHRDVKPANMLVRRGDLQLRVADLGLACAAGAEGADPRAGSHWYQAPELLIERGRAARAATAADMWGAGCVYAEMLADAHRVLFPARTREWDQLGLIIDLVGTPPPAAFAGAARLTPAAEAYLIHLPPKPACDLAAWRPAGLDAPFFAPSRARAAELALLSRLLVFDPLRRATAAACLRDPAAAPGGGEGEHAAAGAPGAFDPGAGGAVPAPPDPARWRALPAADRDAAVEPYRALIRRDFLRGACCSPPPLPDPRAASVARSAGGLTDSGGESWSESSPASGEDSP